MILELDIGNSRIKWRALDAAGEIAGSGWAQGVAALEQQLAACGLRFAKCRVCAVRSALNGSTDYAAAIRQYVAGPVVFASSLAHFAGLRNGYSRPEQLGVDRWLAMLAGFHQAGGACVVIDAGTAITVDYIRADGQHLGGLIAPGYRQMQRNLVTATGLPAAEMPRGGPQTSTAHCVSAGLGAMLDGFVRLVHVEGCRLLGDSVRFLVTGGDAGLVQRYMPACDVRDDLVFAGLALACPFE